MKHHLIAISSDIIEDSYEEGELSATGCGLGNEPVGKTFDSFADMVKYLHDHYGMSNDEADYGIDEVNAGVEKVLNTSHMVADYSNHQNGGWFEPTEAEIELWKKDGMKLYSENFRVRYLNLN